MKRFSFLNGFCFGNLVLLLVGCGGPADENLSNLLGALNPPTAGGGSRSLVPDLEEQWVLDKDGIPQRVASRAGCETINSTRRVKSMVSMTKMMLCMFGAMENADLIARPSGAGAKNYYRFDFVGGGGRSSHQFFMRYGNDASGNLLVNGCETSTPRFEMSAVSTETSGTIKVTDEFQAFGSDAASIHQFIVNATRDSDGYHFQR